MVYYIPPLFYLLICAAFLKNKKIPLFVISIYLVLLSGFRFGIGTDYNSYLRIFNDLPTIQTLRYVNFFDTEVSLLLFKIIIDIFALPEYSIFLFISAVSFFGIKLVMDKAKIDNRYLFVYLYYCFLYFNLNFNLILTGASIPFVALALISKNISERVKYFLIAYSFHITTLIFVPLIFLIDKKINKVVIIFALVLSIIASEMNFILKLMVILSSIMPGAFGQLLTYYSELYSNSGGYGYGVGFFVWLFIYVFLLINKNKLCITKDDKSINLVLNGMLFLLLAYILFNGMPVLLQRVTSLFMFSYFYYLSNFWKFNIFRRDYITLLLYVTFIVTIGIYTFYKVTHGAGIIQEYQFLPYYSVFHEGAL
ncbi:membrane hypothetical protein [Vibrio chagasii]|nr:membrane hypothetical protein [Vibrio chagasii]CAH6907505.1 membrane hypothetical protein [Vibrio chagasii]